MPITAASVTSKWPVHRTRPVKDAALQQSSRLQMPEPNQHSHMPAVFTEITLSSVNKAEPLTTTVKPCNHTAFGQPNASSDLPIDSLTLL